jgi:hypothetical protein
MAADKFAVGFTKCCIAYVVLYGWKLAYKGLTGGHVVTGFASHAVSVALLTLFQFYIPPPVLNPVGAWFELASGARSISSALSSTLAAFAASATVAQLFMATVSDFDSASLAVPHAQINVGDVFFHAVFAEGFVSVAAVLFFNQLVKLVPAFKSAPTFAVTNMFLLLQMQTPLMATLGNVNPSSAFASLLVHQQPAITLSQISGNMLAVAFHAAVNQFMTSLRADTRPKVKQD